MVNCSIINLLSDMYPDRLCCKKRICQRMEERRVRVKVGKLPTPVAKLIFLDLLVSTTKE